MTGGSNRRDALRWALAGVIAPLAASRFGPVARAAERPILVPDQPMRLTRILVRSLGATDSLEIRRSWEVTFSRTSEGISVVGKQTEVEVLAPDRLAPLVQIEKRRVEEGVVPLWLDSHGLIRGEAKPAIGRELDQAVATANGMFADAGFRKDLLQEKQDYLQVLQKSAQSLVSRLPRDLLYPQDLDWHERRAIELPSGLRGELSVHFSAQLCASNSLLDHSSRLVETRIGDTALLSSEEWQLDAA